jgi:hypothetical protein
MGHFDIYEKYKNWQEGKGDDESRHQHLVRWVIRMRIKDRDHAHKWLQGWNEKHPGSILESDVIDQWKKGNKGEGWK